MSRPEDIPEDVWDAARSALSLNFTSPIPSVEVAVSVARVILAERTRIADAPLTEEQAYLDPISILRDAREILDVLLEDRERVIGEECEVTRDLIERVKAVTTPIAP